MNWTAIGAIGEMVGAVGVIVSLAYRAGQIRGNTKALRRTASFQLFKVLEDMHFQHSEGVLDDEQWAGWHWIAAHYLASPGGREYFHFAGQSFSPRFREFYVALQPEASFKRVGNALGIQGP